MRILALLFLLGCGEVLPSEPNPDMKLKDEEIDEVSICYNIDSQYHGQACSRECFDQYDESEFCWTLDADDCQRPFKFDWQHENCHFFD